MHSTLAAFEWPIIAYMILAGTSAGAAITGCVAFLSKAPALASVARQALLIAAVLIGAGFPLLILDLEQPQMFFYILYYFNPASVIAWGARGISLYFMLLAAAVFLRFQLDRSIARTKQFAVPAQMMLRIAVVAVLVLAILVGLYPGFVLNQAAARPLWVQPIIPIMFLFSGLHMGLAVVILARLWSAGDPEFVPEPDDPLLHDHIIVRWIDGVLIALQVVLLASYFFSCLQVAPEATSKLMEGGFGVLLWGGVVVVGWVLPGLDMIVRGAKSSLFARCICILIGGVCLRILVIDGGQQAVAFLGSSS